MQRLKTAAILVAALTLGAGTVAFAGGGDDPPRGKRGDRGDHWPGHRGGGVAGARLATVEGDDVGHVWFKERKGAVWVFARVHDLPPGFHGFHIHTTGACEPPDFPSAGGHLNLTGDTHGGHSGDLPSLLVNEDGSGVLATATDRFSLADLRDEDGSAVMVHSDPDNFAHIPERYGGPDEDTLNTGDAGSRLACGEVR